jgi:hypothetical protein
MSTYVRGTMEATVERLKTAADPEAVCEEIAQKEGYCESHGGRIRLDEKPGSRIV